MTDRDEAIEAAERLIRYERQRQISAEGWTAEHDDQHDDGSLLHAAVFYYRHAIGDHIAMRDDGAPLGWPWDKEWWKPKEPVRNLVRAGALCMAERDRLWRIEMKYASAATRRMARSYNWWPEHVKHKYDAIVEKLTASLNRTEPQTAPTCICPRCSATIVGEMNGPEDEPIAVDAGRLALAELREDNERLNATFDLVHEADMRAIALWREAHPGNELSQPDRAKMVIWLLEQLNALRAEVASADNTAPADAERHALAENIEKYCKAIDEAGEKGWRGAVMGDRVELGRLTHENRDLIISSLRAGGWREDMQS